MARRRISWALAAIALSVGLAGCIERAPVSYDGPPPAQRAPEQPPGRPGAVRVIVKPGDTVYTLAREYGVPVRALIDLNRLQPPYGLKPGQMLELPQNRLHVVQRGDSLYGISRQYRTDITTLARANRLAPPYTIVVGQELRIPGMNEDVIASVPPPVVPRPAAAARPAPEGNADGAEPLSGSDATPVAPGAAAGGGATDAPATQEVAVVAPAPVPPAAQQAQPAQPAAQPVPPPVDEKPRVAERPAALPAPAPRISAKFDWPVRGKVISAFGPKPGGLHNDGINIQAPRGTPVRAAENGVVVYAGNELKGYGNLLLVRHADGWLTAYAHNDTLRVQRGDRVNRGQVIATSGASGNVSEPQVHFEIRRGSQAVDPMPLLAPGGA